MCNTAPALSTERRTLEAALGRCESLPKEWCGDARTIMAAARKHLDTLPKPEPYYVVTGQRLCGGTETCSYQYTHRVSANRTAAEWMSTDRYVSVKVEQVWP